jgi:hypothetical protein
VVVVKAVGLRVEAAALVRAGSEPLTHLRQPSRKLLGGVDEHPILHGGRCRGFSTALLLSA